MVEADLILTGAEVLTQDPEHPSAEAVAFRHDRVLDVGSTAEIEALQGPGTRAIELPSDALVIPGFVDCHTHAARLGEMHWRQDLSKANTREEALQILQAIAERTPEDGWVIGWNWDETTWPEGRALTQSDLDGVSTRHKVLARRVCGHRAIANTRALEAMPFGDEVPGLERENGRLSGRLSEDAAERAWEACAPAYETCVRGLREETQRLASLGITTVADTAGPREVRLLTNGAREGFFDQRSHLYVREEHLDALESLSLGPVEGPRCSLLGVKTYVDGSIGARTAAVSEPYADAEGRGMLLREPEEVAETARRTHELGLQLKAHAIGDRAIDAVLDAVEAAGIPEQARPRVEHAEMITPEQLDRARRLGLVCVMQPNFVGNWQGDDGLYEQALGHRRARAMNPLASVLDADVPLAFSSDGMPYGPLYGIRCAVEHPNKDERLTVEQALAAYTRGAAYALGREHELGVLAPGALGDAVVLGEDPRSAADLETVDVALTVAGGEVLHRSTSLA